MLHRPRPGRQHLLPVLLVSACTAAFGGLVALAPAAADKEPSVLSYSQEQSVPVVAPVERERTVARASRTRQIAATERARAVAAAKAKADAAAKAKAKAAAEAAAEAEAEAKAAAEAEAEEAAAEEAAAEEVKAEAEKEAQQAAKPAAGAQSQDSGSTSVGSGGACPVPSANFTDTYGAPRSGGRAHKGTDMMASTGDPVYAVTGGTVRTASSSAGGISLYLASDNGETYFYAHNSANLASSGERVEAGELIARVGSTGNASGGASHVHFERQIGGSSVNPYSFLRSIC